ncbi:MAG: flavin oxidoreductase/NADH oxidase [Clostridia bacterium]|nr:flavin oxidoreductase/NADH oxidase [Clostridia bacterium]
MGNVYLNTEAFQKENEELRAGLPYSADLSILKAPLQIGKTLIPNRLACQAMEGCDGTATGEPDELTIRRYDRFAAGGAGLIWFEATAVLPEARANPRQLYIHKGNVDAFRREVERIKEISLKQNGYEPVVIMQATHSGRYSKPEGTPAPLIAYNNPIFEKDNPIDKSRIVSDEYLDRVGEALVEGAKLAQEAGFDGVDIKCCHRYLNCELLSAFEREGRYGGSFENRTRLFRESVAGAMQNCDKNFIVTSRLNAYDGFPYPYGFGVATDGSLAFDPTEPIRLLRELRALGMEMINITMGNPYFNPHVNRPFAKGPYAPEEHPLLGVARMLNGTAELKKAVPEMTVLSSALTYLGVAAPNVAAVYIERGDFDLAGFGRTVFAYPDFANDILGNDGMKKEKCCIACSKCTELMRAGSTPGCAIRDPLYTELYRKVILKK